MSMRRGQDARATINGVAFAFNRFRISDRAASLNVSNSEGRTGNSAGTDSPGFMSKTPDLSEGQFELVAASYDETFNLFGTPPNLTPAFWYDVFVYPVGIDNDPWEFPNALLVEVTHEGNVPGLQPLTLRFETDGAYLPPGTS